MAGAKVLSFSFSQQDISMGKFSSLGIVSIVEGKNVSLESLHPIQDAYRQDDSEGSYGTEVRPSPKASSYYHYLSGSYFVHPLKGVIQWPGDDAGHWAN